VHVYPGVLQETGNDQRMKLPMATSQVQADWRNRRF
jgi:hypothetical protein